MTWDVVKKKIRSVHFRFPYSHRFRYVQRPHALKYWTTTSDCQTSADHSTVGRRRLLAAHFIGQKFETALIGVTHADYTANGWNFHKLNPIASLNRISNKVFSLQRANRNVHVLRRAFQLFSVVVDTFSITKTLLLCLFFVFHELVNGCTLRPEGKLILYSACGSVRYKRHAAIDIETTLDNNCRDSATPTPTMHWWRSRQTRTGIISVSRWWHVRQPVDTHAPYYEIGTPKGQLQFFKHLVF